LEIQPIPFGFLDTREGRLLYFQTLKGIELKPKREIEQIGKKKVFPAGRKASFLTRTKRVLILYISAGLGNLITGQAIEHYLHQKRPEWDILLVDVAQVLQAKVFRFAYQDAWKGVLGMPLWLSRLLFDLERALPGPIAYFNQKITSTALSRAVHFLEDHRPDLIMSLHWAGSHLFNQARRKMNLDLPLLYMYGELADANSLMNCGADLYFALSAEAHESLEKEGIPREKLLQIPFLIHPQFELGNLTKEDARRRLGLPADRFTVVLSLGGEGIGLSFKFLNHFAKEVKDATLVVLTGRNTALLSELRARYSGGTICAFGYQDLVGEVLATADVLAGKCGTNYAMLAVKSGRPLIIMHVGAPNEYSNMRILVEAGYGWYCPQPAEFATLINELAHHPQKYAAIFERLSSVSDKNGAETMAESIIEHLEGRSAAGGQARA
jgi:UDP-N-acetylglucosamine:LPS N-acetylglucosamine transferase